jgi:hypothetical protein
LKKESRLYVACQFNFMWSNGPKNTSQYFWTEHAKFKMKYYGLGAQKVLGVIHRPKRKEEGIVKDTIAVMQPAGSKRPSEIWVMYQKKRKANSEKLKTNEKQIHPVKYPAKAGSASGGFNRVKIISAWRYPGISPRKNPIPEEIINDLKEHV